jgi:hypothetical protein
MSIDERAKDSIEIGLFAKKIVKIATLFSSSGDGSN